MVLHNYHTWYPKDQLQSSLRVSWEKLKTGNKSISIRSKNQHTPSLFHPRRFQNPEYDNNNLST
uniref:Uncharacterized protein n=1 Tax=Rhizophora mucronata TaxID=61149 RepID=A0A2P2N3H1_RHIMU